MGMSQLELWEIPVTMDMVQLELWEYTSDNGHDAMRTKRVYQWQWAWCNENYESIPVTMGMV